MKSMHRRRSSYPEYSKSCKVRGYNRSLKDNPFQSLPDYLCWNFTDDMDTKESIEIDRNDATDQFDIGICKQGNIRPLRKNIMKRFAFEFPDRNCKCKENMCVKRRDSMESEDGLKRVINKYERTRNNLCPVKSDIPNDSFHERVYTDKSSPLKAWQRWADKYYADTEVSMSPIKQNLAIIQPLTSDPFIAIYTWILNMSENFYYDSIILLLSRFRDINIAGTEEYHTSASNALRNNSAKFTLETLNHWINVLKLRQGTYGPIYRLQDSRTKEYFKVEYVEPKISTKIEEQTVHLLYFLKQRNSLIRAHNSPFIEQLLKSFILPELDGMFFVFEYSVSDLKVFIDKLSKFPKEDKQSLFMRIFKSKQINTLEMRYKKVSSKLNYDIKDIIIFYAFELFCGLDFLANVGIVHRNIKPSHIKISQAMHLKIADFATVMNVHFITAVSNNKFTHNLLTTNVEKHRYVQAMTGTITYIDPDTVLHNLPQDFMSDAYSVAMVILKMMLLSEDFFETLNNDVHYQEIMKTKNLHRLIYRLTKNDDRFKEHIEEKILALFDDERLKQLATLILPLFRPREQRKTDYLVTKQSRRYDAQFISAHIDIGLIQTKLPFSLIELTPHNVLAYEIPLRTFLDIKSEKKMGRTFKDLYKNKCSYQQKPETYRKRLHIEPGITMIMPECNHY